MGERLAWGDMPYDSKTPAEVVHDYVRVRGDLSEQYARDQLALWIERYAAHAAAEALRQAAERTYSEGIAGWLRGRADQLEGL